jgi:hydroxypyruvate reductase
MKDRWLEAFHEAVKTCDPTRAVAAYLAANPRSGREGSNTRVGGREPASNPDTRGRESASNPDTHGREPASNPDSNAGMRGRESATNHMRSSGSTSNPDMAGRTPASNPDMAGRKRASNPDMAGRERASNPDMAGRAPASNPDMPAAEVGIAIGKAALAMARGARVERGLIISPVDGEVPGWTTIVSSHPFPDERSIEAAKQARAIIESATTSVLALISGGASSLIEDPTVSLDDYIAQVRHAMARGDSIHALNRLRTSLSNVKGGKLVANCRAKITTLVISDVFGDDPRVIGSGPTIADDDSDVHVLLRMRAFAEAIAETLQMPLVEDPITGEHAVLDGPCVAWGEPALTLPDDHGIGGRMQQAALKFARRRQTALCLGSDGVDGPPPKDRPAPAGAFVDATTWDRIIAAGIDPEEALKRRDAGTALAKVGALIVTGPTGVNHADVMIVA